MNIEIHTRANKFFVLFRFTEDIYQMTGIRPGLYWQLTWRYIGPVIMSAILVSSLVQMLIEHPTYSAWDAATGSAKKTKYPNWVLAIAVCMVAASVLPILLVYLLRRFQILQVDLDIHQGSIRRNETTASTKEMMNDDDDVRTIFDLINSLILSVLLKIFETSFCIH